MSELNDLSNTLKMVTQMHSDITYVVIVVFCLEQLNQMMKKCLKNSSKLSLTRSLANHSHPFPLFAILWIFHHSFVYSLSIARWKTPETLKHMHLPHTLECLTHPSFPLKTCCSTIVICVKPKMLIYKSIFQKVLWHVMYFCIQYGQIPEEQRGN